MITKGRNIVNIMSQNIPQPFLLAKKLPPTISQIRPPN
jgi:hypothetical protein